jgi:hypothetical protein
MQAEMEHLFGHVFSPKPKKKTVTPAPDKSSARSALCDILDSSPHMCNTTHKVVETCGAYVP